MKERTLKEAATQKESQMNDCNEVDVRPFAYAMSLISGKWKMHILFWLWKIEVLRYSELKKRLGSITHKMLSAQLKGLPRLSFSTSARGRPRLPA